MRRKKRIIRKRILIAFILIILIISAMIIIPKINEIKKINEYNKELEENINNIFIFSDLNLNYDSVIQKYGRGTDNRNGEGKLFCTTYVSNFGEFNVIKSFHYDDAMNVKEIVIYNHDTSKYEIFNYLTRYLGECIEYNNEIKDLSTEYKWIYKEFEIELKDKIDTNSIAFKKK